ncbi:MAG: LLM class F420-dependent oxidoreductase [Chloroflexota bacterium]|nr:LLM class F420-dependent oxidoreductase [Chloroflexota bacterium]
MKIGLQLPAFKWDGPQAIPGGLAEIARAAEDAGFSSLWVMDHFFQIPGVGPKTDPMLEGYSALSYLAALTRRVTLGTLVTGVIYRQPGILLKTVTTLDVLSGGRAYFGVGAGWNEDESRGLGVPFPSVGERMRRLEETLQLAHRMFGGDSSSFEGPFHTFAEPLNVPAPLSRPHPPIMVGGGGEKRTLRLAARYADACNLFTRPGLDVVGHKIDVLRRHCEAEGRAIGDIEVTTLSTAHLAPGQQTPEDVRSHLRALARLGVQHAIFNMPNVRDIRPLETFAREIIPAAGELPTANGGSERGIEETAG